MSDKNKPESFPLQHQKRHPGHEHKMKPEPEYIREDYKGSGKLINKVAIITGGDSGIGRAVCVHFAREGADIVLVYLNEHKDADLTRKLIENEGRKVLILTGDLGEETFCTEVADKAMATFGKIDILVNNAAEQHFQEDFIAIPNNQIRMTFRTNILSMFYLTKEVLRHMKEGANIINTTSVTAYRGSAHLIDYASTKGAILSFTRALSANLADKKIRVNGVAPGPIWTPFIPSSFPAGMVQDFGQDSPMGRAGQPSEVAPAFVFLASKDASYFTGQVLHPNGGELIGG